MAASRSEARERALELLYEAELKGIGVSELLAEQLVPVDSFASELAEGVDRERSELDATYGAVLVGWTPDRLSTVDRILLRLATFELVHLPDIPVASCIDEAVKLARRYSSDAAPAFVNGVLAAVARSAR